MGDADVGLDRAVGSPAKMLEERHVGRLDVSAHNASAPTTRGSDSESDERYAERETPKWREHREAITLPSLTIFLEWKEPNGSARIVTTKRHHF